MISKTCEKCGEVFDCAHSADCWCFEFKISENLSKYFAKNFRDCLCKSCLTYFIENEKNILAE